MSGAALANCKNKKPLRIGFGDAWPPYVMYRESKPFGLEVDIARLIFKQAGYCLEFVKLPTSDRGIKELSSGLIDILPMTSKTIQRELLGNFSMPYRHERMRLYTAKPLEPITSLKALFTNKNTTFVINRGAFYGDEVKALLKHVDTHKQFIYVDTIKQRMQLVARKRVDFSIDDEIAGNYFLAANNSKKVKVHSYVVNDNQVHYMLNKQRFSEQERLKISAIIVSNRHEINTLIKFYTNQTTP